MFEKSFDYHATALLVMIILIISMNCYNDDQPSAPKDVTAPAVVSDLRAGNATDSSITLTWTASGDDGNTGTAQGAQIRYSIHPITIDNMAESDLAVMTHMHPAGDTESYVVNGLNAGMMYYFVERTYDEALNFAAISNWVRDSTLSSSK